MRGVVDIQPINLLHTGFTDGPSRCPAPNQRSQSLAIFRTEELAVSDFSKPIAVNIRSQKGIRR